MSSSESNAQLQPEPDAADLVEVAAPATTAAGFERGLVVLATGAPFWLMPAENGFRLLVKPDDAAHAREQLACFERENAGWPPAPPVENEPRRKLIWLAPLGWAVVTTASFWWQTRANGWTAAGALDARALFERGEWWRLLTALFLHADAAHLLSNLMSGGFVLSAVLTTMGRWRGWLLLAVAAVTGNLAAAALHGTGEYRSLGASTGVFAALGLLTGRAVRRILGSGHPHRGRTLAAPLAAGLTVLGLFGAGGVEVDVIAHATGFAAGLLLGFVAERKKAPAKG